MPRYICSLLTYSLLTLFLPLTPLFSEEPPFQLQYQPGVPVLLSSSVTLQIEEELSGESELVQAKGMIEAELVVEGKTPSEAQSPIDLILTLKKMRFEINSAGQTLTFDSEHPDASMALAQLSQLIGRPLNFRVVVGSRVVVEDPSFEDAIEDLPEIASIFPRTAFRDLFQNLFMLAGDTLAKGSSFEKELVLGTTIPFPVPVKYLVTSASGSDIQAEMNGKFEKQLVDLQIEGALQGADVTAAPISLDVGLTVVGEVAGFSQWNRQHALLHKSQITWSYTGNINIDQSLFPVKMTVTHALETKKKG